MVIRSGSLDILCRPWAPNAQDLLKKGYVDDLGLPSWICSVDRSPFSERPDGNYSRVNADLLVGDADAVRRRYNAAGETRQVGASNGCQVWSAAFPRSLFAVGFILDEVVEVAKPAVEGNVPHKWLEFGGWEDTSKEPPESFWRTLLADQDLDGQIPPSFYRRACQHAFALRAKGASLNIERLILNENSQVIKDFLRRVQAVVFMRSLMKTKRSYNIPLGLVPSDAQRGDLVCILRGCNVPVIIRSRAEDMLALDTAIRMPFSTFESLGQGEYSPRIAPQTKRGGPWRQIPALPGQLIGECYLYGMLDGEALAARTDNDIIDTRFRLD